MKSVLSIVLAIFLSHVSVAQEKHFGKNIDDKNAIVATNLIKELGDKESAIVKVEGEVVDVCQMKGCWMTIKLDNGETMRVKFKDYAFFVPKNIQGRTVVFEGEAKIKTTPVAELRHYAYDAGKSKEEIEKIKEPKKELTFLADGVLLK